VRTCLAFALALTATSLAAAVGSTRVATFNCSLHRNNAGQLITDLSTPNNAQAATVAEIMQRVAPDVVLLNEFDYDNTNSAATLFQQNYLSVSHNGTSPIEYPYVFVASSNTGIPSGFDLNNNGSSGFPVGDAAAFRSPGSVRRPAPEKRKAIFRAAPLGLQRVRSVMWAPDRPPSPSHAPDPCGGDATATAGSLSSFSVDRTATSTIAV